MVLFHLSRLLPRIVGRALWRTRSARSIAGRKSRHAHRPNIFAGRKPLPASRAPLLLPQPRRKHKVGQPQKIELQRPAGGVFAANAPRTRREAQARRHATMLKRTRSRASAVSFMVARAPAAPAPVPAPAPAPIPIPDNEDARRVAEIVGAVMQDIPLDVVAAQAMCATRATLLRARAEQGARERERKARDRAFWRRVAEEKAAEERARVQAAEEEKAAKLRAEEEEKRRVEAEREMERVRLLAEERLRAARAAEQWRKRREEEIRRRKEEEIRRRREEEIRLAEARQQAEAMRQQEARRQAEAELRRQRHERLRRLNEESRRAEEALRREALRAEELLRAREAERHAQAQAAEQVLFLQAYEQKWAAVKDMPMGPPTWTSVDVPWPLIPAPGLTTATRDVIEPFLFHPLRESIRGKTRKEVLRAEMLRWHPDKFNARVACKVVEEQRDWVVRAGGDVARVLTEMMEEENR